MVKMMAPLSCLAVLCVLALLCGAHSSSVQPPDAVSFVLVGATGNLVGHGKLCNTRGMGEKRTVTLKQARTFLTLLFFFQTPFFFFFFFLFFFFFFRATYALAAHALWASLAARGKCDATYSARGASRPSQALPKASDQRPSRGAIERMPQTKEIF